MNYLDRNLFLTQLTNECEQWHYQIFGFKPSRAITQHYENANTIYQEKMNSLESYILSSISNQKIDFEALEFFWRLLNNKNILTQKKMILLSICEIYPEYKHYYSNYTSSNIVKAFFILTYFTLRSVYKLAKGSFIFFVFIKPKLSVLKPNN